MRKPKNKTCTKCKKSMPLGEFYPDRRKYRKEGSVRPSCKKCDGVKAKEYALAHPEQTANKLRSWRLSHYGLTIESFNKLLEEQGNKCAACGTKEPGGNFNQWHIDHDHSCCGGKDSCGKCIRGILCASCNRTLGAVKDNPKQLRALIVFLERTKRDAAF